MLKSRGYVIRCADEVETCQEDPATMSYLCPENIHIPSMPENIDISRNSTEYRLRDEAITGYTTEVVPEGRNDDRVPDIWHDSRIFVSFFLSVGFGIVMPVVQFIVGGAYFGVCNDGNTFSVYLVIGGLLDIVGGSTFSGLVQRLTEREELTRDPQTEWSKRIWNLICSAGIVSWIVIGQMHIYNLTHRVNPFRSDLPCALQVGILSYAQIFIAIKLAAIAVGLSLGIAYVLLKNEGSICWRKYSLKK